MLKSKREQRVTQANCVMKPVVLWQLFFHKNQRFIFIFLGRMAPQNSVQDPMVGKMIFVSMIFKLPEMYSLSDLICLHSAYHATTLVPRWFSQDPLWVTQDKKKAVKS